MRHLESRVAGRVKSIRRNVIVGGRDRRANPGFADLSAKLARASEQVKGSRHGRRPR